MAILRVILWVIRPVAPAKNWRIFLEQIFAICMPLLIATSAFVLGMHIFSVYCSDVFLVFCEFHSRTLHKF